MRNKALAVLLALAQTASLSAAVRGVGVVPQTGSSLGGTGAAGASLSGTASLGTPGTAVNALTLPVSPSLVVAPSFAPSFAPTGTSPAGSASASSSANPQASAAPSAASLGAGPVSAAASRPSASSSDASFAQSAGETAGPTENRTNSGDGKGGDKASDEEGKSAKPVLQALKTAGGQQQGRDAKVDEFGADAVPFEDAAQLAGRYFDNTMKPKAAGASGGGVSWGGGRLDSDRTKTLTAVYRVGDQKVLKLYSDAAYASNELALRRFFNAFPQLKDLFDIPQANGARYGLFGRKASLIMEDKGTFEGQDIHAELPIKHKVALALAQTFGLSDMNGGGLFIVEGKKPVLLDLEHLGFPHKPQNNRFLILFDMPWVGQQHYQDIDDYLPEIRRWKAAFVRPETQEYLRRTLRESGMSAWRTKRELQVMLENLDMLEDSTRADVDFANAVFERSLAEQAGIQGRAARIFSAINRPVYAGDDRSLVEFTRAFLERAGWTPPELRRRHPKASLWPDEAAFLFRARPDGLTREDKEWALAAGHGAVLRRFLEIWENPPAAPTAASSMALNPRTSETVSNWGYESLWLKIKRWFS